MILRSSPCFDCSMHGRKTLLKHKDSSPFSPDKVTHLEKGGGGGGAWVRILVWKLFIHAMVGAGQITFHPCHQPSQYSLHIPCKGIGNILWVNSGQIFWWASRWNKWIKRGPKIIGKRGGTKYMYLVNIYGHIHSKICEGHLILCHPLSKLWGRDIHVSPCHICDLCPCLIPSFHFPMWMNPSGF